MLIDHIGQPLPLDANELQVHQYAHCYVLALQGDMIFVDKSKDRVHLMWLEFMQNLCNLPKKAKQIGGPLILVQLWIYARFPHMSPQKVSKGVCGPPPPPIPLAMN